MIGAFGNSTASARDPAAVRAASSGSPTAPSSGAHLARNTTAAPTSAPSLARRASASACPWLNQSLSMPERVDMLMSRMSLPDKVAEMYIDEGASSGS